MEPLIKKSFPFIEFLITKNYDTTSYWLNNEIIFYKNWEKYWTGSHWAFGYTLLIKEHLIYIMHWLICNYGC